MSHEVKEVYTHGSSDAEAWEDISDSQHPIDTRISRKTPSPNGSLRSRGTSRKKPTLKTVYSGASPRKTRSNSSRPSQSIPNPPIPAPQNPQIQIPTDEILQSLLTFLRFSIRYSIDVLSQAVHFLRKPLSLILCLWLFSLIIGRVSHTLQSAFRPVCFLPGMSRMNVCNPNYGRALSEQGKAAPRWADYPRLVDVQSASVEQLLDDSVGGSALSLNVKKAEMATSDLVTLIRISNLQSKDLLAESLSSFVDHARLTGRGLQKLSSKVGGAVDQIYAVNDFALHSIEAAHVKDASAYSVIVRAVAPWSTSSTSEVVLRTFTDSMNTLSSEIRRLIIEGEAQLLNLQNLEEDLGVIHGIMARENLSISTAKVELLSELWTKLGGNKRTLRGYEDHLTMLKDLEMYRKRAAVYVVTALHTLRALNDDMEVLSNRVAAPDVTGSQIPVEVHMMSIKGGLERMREGRTKARQREDEALRNILGVGMD